MEWRTIRCAPDYQISDTGECRRVVVCRGHQEKPIKSHHDRYGYRVLHLMSGGKRIYRRVHKLVAEEFIGPRPAGKHVCHWDDNKNNNSLQNLRYASAAENGADRVRNGKTRVGEKNPHAKLSDEDVRRIREALLFGARQVDLARAWGISKSSMLAIKDGRTWRHVDNG